MPNIRNLDFLLHNVIQKSGNGHKIERKKKLIAIAEASNKLVVLHEDKTRY